MKKILFLVIGLLLVTFAVAESAENNSSLTLKLDGNTGLYILSMKDGQGLRSFSLVFPTDKLPYGGDLNGCAPSKTIDNISINSPADFTPVLNAVIVDCRGNETEFEIAAPVDGIAAVKKTGIEPTPTPAEAVEPSNSSKGAAGGASSGTATAAADPAASIQYPIKELGNCGSRGECKAFCEVKKNIDKCIAYAESHNLLAKQEIDKNKKFSAALKSGGTPGGCSDEKECHTYCNDTDKLNECIAFAEKNGLMDTEELAEAKKIQSIIGSGKSLPGNCKNRAACEAYCKNPEHMDECIAFAKEAGFMSEKEIAEAEKILPLMKSGQMPGGCRSREECEAFCADVNNFEACSEFAYKAGFISEKEREMLKKTGGRGPGGCKGRACENFCNNPANQKACFEFGREHGLISEEDLKRMQEGKEMLRKQLESGPPEVRECLRSVVDINVLESDGFGGGPELGEKMRECFEKMGGGQFGTPPDGQTPKTGPGGCTSREECDAYCRANPDQCGRPQGMEGGTEPGGGAGFSGPGGCTSREECEAYCRAHMDECQKFMEQSLGSPVPPSGGGTMPCPAMPTVSECPQGSERTKVYSSPECGEYYACKPTSADGTLPSTYDEQFHRQYEDQYKTQYQEQYQQQYQQQYEQQSAPSPTPSPATTSYDPIRNPFALILWPILQILK